MANPSETLSTEQKIRSLFSMLEAEGQGDYIGESVSQLEHCLQAAHSAQEAGASEETVLAALLHDCGQILPQTTLHSFIPTESDSLPKAHIGAEMSLPDGTSVGRHGHEDIGARYLSALGFSPTVCQLVKDHVVAKRYLTAVEDGYCEGLSEASRSSLGFQGGPFTPEEVEAFEADPLSESKVMMRRFDDGAKVVGLVVPGLKAYVEMAVGHLDGQLRR